MHTGGHFPLPLDHAPRRGQTRAFPAIRCTVRLVAKVGTLRHPVRARADRTPPSAPALGQWPDPPPITRYGTLADPAGVGRLRAATASAPGVVSAAGSGAVGRPAVPSERDGAAARGARASCARSRPVAARSLCHQRSLVPAPRATTDGRSGSPPVTVRAGRVHTGLPSVRAVPVGSARGRRRFAPSARSSGG